MCFRLVHNHVVMASNFQFILVFKATGQSHYKGPQVTLRSNTLLCQVSQEANLFWKKYLYFVFCEAPMLNVCV